MHIQTGGTWGDLITAVQRHTTVVLKVDGDDMVRAISKNLKNRLRKELVNNLVVVRTPEHDQENGYIKRYGYLVTLAINNQQAKSLLFKEET